MLKKIYETKIELTKCSEEQLQQLSFILQENLPNTEIIDNHDGTFVIRNNQDEPSTIEEMYQKCNDPVITWINGYISNNSIQPYYLFDIKPLSNNACILKI